MNWAFNFVAKKGFTPITTPDMANINVVEACGFQPRDEAGQIYKVEGN